MTEHVKTVRSGAGLNCNLAAGRRIAGGVLEQVRQGDRSDSWIDIDLGLGVRVHLQWMAVESVPDVGRGRIDDVGGRDPLAFDVDRRRVDARHVEDVLEETVQPVQLSDGGAGLGRVFAGRQMTAQVLDRHADRRERRLEIVTE